MSTPAVTKVKLVGIMLVLLSATLVAAQAVKPRLAIKTFDNPTTSANSTIGNALTDLFFTELGRTGRFQLVERAAFDEVAKEVDFGTTDWAKKGTFASRGGALGTQFILLGKVTNFSFDEQAVTENVATSRGVVAQTSYRQSAQVRVDFRVVSVATGVSIVTESGEDRQSTVSATSERANYQRLVQVGMFSAEAQNSLIGRATMGAIRNAVRKLGDLAGELTAHLASVTTSASVESVSVAAGQVIADVGGGAFIVGVGSGQGIKVGDRLTVFAEQVTRNKQGQVVYQEEQRIGTLEVVDVSMADRARTKLVSDGAVRPKEGDKVRIDMTRAAEVRGAAATVEPGRTAASTNAADDLVRRGDRYYEDKYFAQALDQYKQASELKPSDPVILNKVAGAHLELRQFAETEEIAEQLLKAGQSVTFHVRHHHSGDWCTGTLTLANSQLSYRPLQGGHPFAASVQQIMSIKPSSCYRRPICLEFVVEESDGKSKKYNLLPDVFLQTRTGASGGASEEAVRDTERAARMLYRLLEAKYPK